MFPQHVFMPFMNVQAESARVQPLLLLAMSPNPKTFRHQSTSHLS